MSATSASADAPKDEKADATAPNVVAEGAASAAVTAVVRLERAASTDWISDENWDLASAFTVLRSPSTVVSPFFKSVKESVDVTSTALTSSIEDFKSSTELQTSGLSLPPHAESNPHARTAGARPMQAS